jgi:uncharacterized repeat protein (TIGR01451 family)
MTNPCFIRSAQRAVRLILVLFLGIFMVAAFIRTVRPDDGDVYAAPIDPPVGYPKLSMSTKTVTPLLAGIGGATLTYIIEIRNTGAYTAFNTSWVDTIPLSTTYNNDVWSSAGSLPIFADGKLEWTGDVGFDATVEISFSVDLSTTFAGSLINTAVISHPMISDPVTVTAETVITDDPILKISKSSTPDKPGANKPLTYWLTVTNRGQDAIDLPIEVIDHAPLSTAVDSVGPDGATDGSVVTWTRNVSLDFGESTVFSFTAMVGDVPSGTLITNDNYRVNYLTDEVSAGEVHTTTIIDPILMLWKNITPDPPGSNREMTYILSLFNKGSLATGLVIMDRVPSGVTYVDGGTETDGVVHWDWPSLDTGETVHFTYTVYIDDVADVAIANDDYTACSLEGVCVQGEVITSVVHGPTFEVHAYLDPIAKKPGGGGGPVTPTLTLRNLGPGNAIDAQATLYFRRISVSANDLYADPAIGTLPPFPPGPNCGDKCVSYVWVGSLGVGEMISFTTIEGQSTIGGEEGTGYTATIVVSDTLSNITTEPVSTTTSGKITHFANLIPTKSAPSVIGRSQYMTYTIQVWNSGLSTEEPPYPTLTETLPLSMTLVSVSDGGMSSEVDGRTVISWTLPAMGPGAVLWRTFSVLVDNDLVSGTLLVNDSYKTIWHESEITTTDFLSHTGVPITTTVIDAGLIDSYKVVKPGHLEPGEDNLLNYYLHIVNSSAIPLTGVEVYDVLPWEHSTYLRDAVASAGTVISDIISILWTGDVGAFSSEIVSMSVAVDPYYQGILTNTATITHSSLLDEVTVDAVAYITSKPVLQITKSATQMREGDDTILAYKITVVNLGKQATDLVVTDAIPSNTEYVSGSGTAGAIYQGGMLQWHIPVLDTGNRISFEFRVRVNFTDEVINEAYQVTCAEGVSAIGAPVITKIIYGGWGGKIYLPLVMR